MFVCLSPRSVRGAMVLVTGASTGIREQVEYHYSKMGGQIVITARKELALQKVAENSTSLGAQKALYVTGDVCQASDPEGVVRMNVFDILVLNHIGSSPFAIWNGDREHVRELMQIRFVFFLYIRLYLALHLGSVIVVSSLLGEYTTHGLIHIQSYTDAHYTSTPSTVFLEGNRTKICPSHSNVSLTITTLGLIDTQSIYSHTNMMVYPACDAALHLITHQKKSFCPVYIYLACLPSLSPLQVLHVGTSKDLSSSHRFL
uniref:Uncharacterized protein n=1 Tax=Oncorhynchus mykiss TaxID=8022 RepID=A0A8C7QYC4_ONCMY